MTQEEYKGLLELLDDRYVLQSDCNDRQEAHNNRFANDNLRIEKLLDKFKTWDKLLWVIATSGIGALVTAVLNLILK